MKKILAALLLVGSVGCAHAQQSKAALNTEISTNWPNNTTGAITPALLRTTVSDIVASYVDWLTCTAKGGTLYWDAAAAPACLAAGSAGYLLSMQSGIPAWVAPSASSLTLTNNQRFIGNQAGANQAAQELTANSLFDWIASTRGMVFYRGSAAWAGLSPGTANYVLTSNGAGADPSYADPATLLTTTTNQRMFGRATSGTGAQQLSTSTIVDWLGSTRGSILYRAADPTGWAILAPGTSGYVLTSQGAGADPTYVNPSSGGTVTSVTCGSGIVCTPNPITTAGTISPDSASASNIWSGTGDKTVLAAPLKAAGLLQTLVAASPTVAVNFSAGANFALYLTGNSQLGNPSNPTPGHTGCIFITKDSTSRTLSYNSNWKFAGGTAPVLSTTETTNPDALCYIVYTATSIWGAMTKAIK